MLTIGMRCPRRCCLYLCDTSHLRPNVNPTESALRRCCFCRSTRFLILRWFIFVAGNPQHRSGCRILENMLVEESCSLRPGHHHLHPRLNAKQASRNDASSEMGVYRVPIPSITRLSLVDSDGPPMPQALVLTKRSSFEMATYELSRIHEIEKKKSHPPVSSELASIWPPGAEENPHFRANRDNPKLNQT